MNISNRHNLSSRNYRPTMIYAASRCMSTYLQHYRTTTTKTQQGTSTLLGHTSKRRGWIKPSSPLSNNFQKQIGQFSWHSNHRIMARWQLSQTPPCFRWRKCSRRQYVGQDALHE